MNKNTALPAKLILDQTVSLKSGCKINLFLEITGILPSGYHSLRTYMAPLDTPQDLLVVTPPSSETKNGPSFCKIVCDVPGIDLENNTLTRAYRLFAEKMPQTPDLQIELIKGVPCGAGLGGGSADAATLLVFLNNYMRKHNLAGLNASELVKTAAQIGADVPFFIHNTPSWAEGFGECITPDPSMLEPYYGMYLVLVCPKLHVSTSWAYAAWDKMQSRDAKILTSVRHQDTNNAVVVPGIYNSFEAPVFSQFPLLAQIKETLAASGARAALMSGSGSSMFGIFASGKAAKAAETDFRNQGFAVYTQVLHAGVSPSW